jgi:hypothetical protein
LNALGDFQSDDYLPKEHLANDPFFPDRRKAGDHGDLAAK